MFTHTIVHYAEIGLKKGNRPFFERKLTNNIRAKVGRAAVKRLHGRIVINSADDNVLSSLAAVFGIADYSPCIISGLDIESIKKNALKVAECAAKSKKIESFRIAAKRANKTFPFTSQKINEEVGDAIIKKYGWRVDLKSADLIIYIEIDKNAYIYVNKIHGLGGLPVGTAGKVVCLLSGGIDSPVAAWYAMKRGCEVVFVHFHTYTSRIENKLEEIVKILSKYQNSSKLYLIPFFDTQEEVIKNVPEKFRMLLYRKMMLRIGEEVLRRENALAFVTGDNLAQVASQTLENLNVIYSATRYPILAPLIGFDKKEIVKVAECIGTYSSSIAPYKDCCSFLIGKHPSTRTDKKDITEFEKKISLEKLIKDAVSRAEVREVLG